MWNLFQPNSCSLGEFLMRKQKHPVRPSQAVCREYFYRFVLLVSLEQNPVRIEDLELSILNKCTWQACPGGS